MKKANATIPEDSAQFNFSLVSTAVTGFTNVFGSPHSSVRTATGAYGIGISSVATNRWNPTASATAATGTGTSGSNSVFPSTVIANNFFTQTPAISSSTPNIELNGLVPGATYTITTIHSRATAGNPRRDMDVFYTDANGTTVIENVDALANLTNTVKTGLVADSNGRIFLTISTVSPADPTNGPFAYLNGLKIKRTN